MLHKTMIKKVKKYFFYFLFFLTFILVVKIYQKGFSQKESDSSFTVFNETN